MDKRTALATKLQHIWRMRNSLSESAFLEDCEKALKDSRWGKLSGRSTKRELSRRDFLKLPIKQRRERLKKQVDEFLKTNPDFHFKPDELAPCPISEQCHDDMMTDCEHCNYFRCRVAQLAYDKQRRVEPQQPAEGELIDIAKACPYPSDGTTCECIPCCGREIAEAQLAHMKAQGWVKLPDEEEMERLIGQAILISYNKYSEHLEDENMPATGKGMELLRLLKGEA